MINIHKLSKSYGDKTALKDISLSIQQGNIFGIMGRNGAGKTTLIKSILGEIDYSGEIKVSPSLLKNNKTNLEQVYFVSDTPHVYDYLTAIEYIQFVLRIKNRDNPKPEKVTEVLNFFGIEETEIFKLIKDYSFGMKRKVVLAAGFLLKPSLMILDEPTIGLDVPSVIALKRLIISSSKAGMIFVITSHDPSLMSELCTDLLIVHDGQNVYFNDNFKDEKESLDKIYIQKIGENIDSKINSLLE